MACIASRSRAFALDTWSFVILPCFDLEFRLDGEVSLESEHARGFSVVQCSRLDCLSLKYLACIFS